MKAARWRRPSLWQCYLAGGAVVTALYALVPPFKGNGPVINLLGLSGSLPSWWASGRNRPKSRWPWRLFALGLLPLLGGRRVHVQLPASVPRDRAVPVPSAMPVYLTVYPALMAGLLLLVRRRKPGA